MGKLINCCSGADLEHLPMKPIKSILYNVPDSLTKDPDKTRKLISESEANLVIQDSGGFTLHQILAAKTDKSDNQNKQHKNKVITFNESKKIIFDLTEGKKKKAEKFTAFNMTPAHIIKAAKMFGPTAVISPDFPVPKVQYQDEQGFQFLKCHGYNMFCAKRVLKLAKENNLKSNIIIPVQAYTLPQLEMIINELDGFEYDGLSIPQRNHDAIDIAMFLLKIRQKTNIRYVHILGTQKYSFIAVAAYFVRHNIFDTISMDCTLPMRDSDKQLYYTNHDLRPVRLQMGAKGVESFDITCSCATCYGKTFWDIANQNEENKRSDLTYHNYFVIEEAMRDFTENADTASNLRKYLKDKTTRFVNIEYIYNILFAVEKINGRLSDSNISMANNRLKTKWQGKTPVEDDLIFTE